MIESGPKDKIVDAGNTIMLDCVASGEPAPEIGMCNEQ